MKKLIFILIVLLAVFGVYKMVAREAVPTQNSQIIKINENVSEFTTKLGEKISVFGITFKPIEITENSLCPDGVQCVWAGRLLVKVEMDSSTGATSTIFELRSPKSYDGYKITLENAEEISSKDNVEPEDAEYYFTFRIEK